MLITRAQQVVRKITELKNLASVANDAKLFSTRATQLQEPTAEFRQLVNILLLFRRRQIPVPFDASRVFALREPLRSVTARYQEEPHSIVEADHELRYSFWDQLKTLPDSLRTPLEQAWQAYVDNVLPAPQQQLLLTLERLSGYQSQVLRIRQLYLQAAHQRAQLPQTPDDIDRVTQIAASLRDAWQGLPTEGIPEEVHTFLTAAFEGTATLSQLTERVARWLYDHHLQDSVRISLKAQPS